MQAPTGSDTALEAGDGRRERILDPLSRVSEVLFGVIMALTFTTTIDAASGGKGEIRTLLFAALGCNLAWGLVDAVMFMMNVLGARGRDLVNLRAVRAAGTPEQAHRLIADAMPPALAWMHTAGDFERIRQGLNRHGPAVGAAPGEGGLARRRAESSCWSFSRPSRS